MQLQPPAEVLCHNRLLLWHQELPRVCHNNCVVLHVDHNCYPVVVSDVAGEKQPLDASVEREKVACGSAHGGRQPVRTINATEHA